MAIYEIKLRLVPNPIIFDSDEYERKLRSGLHPFWIKEVETWCGGIEWMKKLGLGEHSTYWKKELHCC